jgi:hypothetical protein
MTADWIRFSDNRWDRKRKLLPKLKLSFPSSEELRSIAELAKVDDTSRQFGHVICSRVLDAHLDDESFRSLARPQVKKTLKSVTSQVNRLRAKLCKLDVGRGSVGSFKYAGLLIEVELYAAQKSKKEGIILLPEYIELLSALSDAAERAVRRPMNMKKGAGGNPAFDCFIRSLVMAARMFGGKWTNYRQDDQTWCGTLLDALEILKKYLPQGFFPPGEIGGSIDHIRNKLNKSIDRALVREGRS